MSILAVPHVPTQMKIVHHFTHVDEAGGGVPRSTFDLSLLLADAGHKVALMAAAGSTFPTEWTDDGSVTPMLLEELGRPFERLSRSGLRRVEQTLEDYDILHLHGLWRSRNAQIAFIAQRMGVPYVVSPHGMLSRWSRTQRAWLKVPYFHLVERKTLDRAAVIHATATGEKRQIREWLPSSAIEVVPVAVDLSSYEIGDQKPVRQRPPANNSSDEPRILFISRLHYKKGCEFAIEAIAELRDRGVQSRLLIAGDGEPTYQRSLSQLIETLQVSDCVEFLGLVVGERKRSLYRSVDLAVLPTYQENFGIVLIEALASGTPVVTTRGTDIWPEIQESGGGIIVGQSAKGLADGIAELLADPKRLDQMGRRGKAAVEEWLAPGKVVAQYEQMYQRALRE